MGGEKRDKQQTPPRIFWKSSSTLLEPSHLCSIEEQPAAREHNHLQTTAAAVLYKQHRFLEQHPLFSLPLTDLAASSCFAAAAVVAADDDASAPHGKAAT